LSTAFCHCEYDTLDEMVYPSPANPEDVMRAVEWMDDYTLEMITPRLLLHNARATVFERFRFEKTVGT